MKLVLLLVAASAVALTTAAKHPQPNTNTLLKRLLVALEVTEAQTTRREIKLAMMTKKETANGSCTDDNVPIECSTLPVSVGASVFSCGSAGMDVVCCETCTAQKKRQEKRASMKKHFKGVL